MGLLARTADGDGLTGEIEQDVRSLALTEINLAKVILKTCLKAGEEWIKGEEFLKRLLAVGDIRLDAGIFQHIWENQHLFPQIWKELTNGQTTFVFFFGSPLRSPGGSRCVLYLYWGGRPAVLVLPLPRRRVVRLRSGGGARQVVGGA